MGNKPHRDKGKPKKKWDRGKVKPNHYVTRSNGGAKEETPDLASESIKIPANANLVLSCKWCIEDKARPKYNRLVLVGKADELTILLNLHKALEHPQSIQEVQV